MKALQQLLHEVDWGGLDVLVLDLPPGTGDTQLTITQQIVLDGNYICSPWEDKAHLLRCHDRLDTPGHCSKRCCERHQHVQED